MIKKRKKKKARRGAAYVVGVSLIDFSARSFELAKVFVVVVDSD